MLKLRRVNLLLVSCCVLLKATFHIYHLKNCIIISVKNCTVITCDFDVTGNQRFFRPNQFFDLKRFEYSLLSMRRIFITLVLNFIGERLDCKAVETLEAVFKRVQFVIMDVEATSLDEDVRISFSLYIFMITQFTAMFLKFVL